MSTTLHSNQTPVVGSWTQLTAGPYWRSWEQFRQTGNTALASLRPGTVAMIQTKAGNFRILHDKDFQRLVGLAADVHRLKQGVTVVAQAAKVLAKHPDTDTVEMLIKSVSILTESAVLPEREGHGEFIIRAEELEAANLDDDIDLVTLRIPRPKL